MNTRVRTTSHILKSPAKHGKIVKSPSQQEKKEKIEKQGSRLVEAQKASMNKRRLNKEKKMALLEDVDKLKKKLRHEESVHRALERAFTRPLGALPRLPPYLPPSTLELLAEVAVLEEEIVLLEGQVVNFRQGLYEEAVYISSSKRNKENQTDLGNTKRKQFKEDQPSSSSSQSDGTYMVNLAQLGSNRNLDRIANCSKRNAIGKEFLKKPESSSLLSDDRGNKDNQTSITTPTKSNKQSPNSIERIRRPVKRASMDQKTMEKLLEPLEHKVEGRMVDQSVAKENSSTIFDERGPEGQSSTPNKISEDLLKCLKTIFMRMSVQNREDYKETEFRDPYSVCKEFQQRDIGPYKCLCAIENSSINTSRMTTSWFLLQRLKLLLGKLAAVDLQGLTHQQKLALWINIYNSCMMNAFLEHGIPESPQMVVALMQKAMINVGGQLLNAMTIEHFILRLPYHSKDMYTKGDAKSDEIKARSIIGLEWSEPLVTFALSCGSWSSPAVRVYTASGIENELEEAKKDYLQAAIRISTDQKIGIPKLLDWYLLDFAKDFQSLLDWICLQLPSDLRKEALKCLEGSSKEILARSVQVMPYEFSFRYLLHQ